MQIPYKIFLESKKTNLPVVGKSYYTVPPEMGIIEPENEDSFIVIPNKNHNQVQKVKSKEETLYKETK